MSNPSQIHKVPLAFLNSGHDYPDANLNCRTVGRNDGIETLKASIAAEGLLQALLVCEGKNDAGIYYVIDGNRRLEALKALAADGALDGASGIPVIFLQGDIDPVDALRKSLAANDHLPLHPVDRFEAFAACHAKGDSPAVIATRYAVSERTVKQSLALGKLAPPIREAWRAGQIDAETAQAYTLAPTMKAQETSFKALAKKNEHDAPWAVRRHFIQSNFKTGDYLLFVTKAAYEAAGGIVNEDLFGTNHQVSDIDLLKKMVGEKIDKKCAELIADGWAWASPSDLMPNDHYSWQRLKDGEKAAPDRKKLAGCAVDFSIDDTDDDGNELPEPKVSWDIGYGFIKPKKSKTGAHDEPGAEKTKAKGNPNSKAPKEIVLPRSLQTDLTNQLTQAVAMAMQHDVDVAMAALIAGSLSWGDGPMLVSMNGLATDRDEPENFLDAFIRILALPRKDKIECIAKLSARALDLKYGKPDQAAAITAVCDGKKLNENLALLFDGQTYFAKAPKPFALQCIADTCGIDAAKSAAKKKHEDVAKLACTAAREHSWLPAELRSKHYTLPVVNLSDMAADDTPANKPAKAAKKAKPAKKTEKSKPATKAKPAKKGKKNAK